MHYPIEILPNPNYKLINCDLSDYFVIRFFNTNNTSELLDPETKKVTIQNICSPTERIDDLSMSLLGIYKPDHIYLDFTPKGKLKFLSYCEPDIDPVIPIFENDFVLNENRHFWWIPIEKVHKKKVEYKSHDKPFVATCFVCHTPMLWNYWHFSLRWNTELGPLDKMDEKLRKKAAKRIGHSARVIISHFASIDDPDLTILPPTCYMK